MRIIGGSDYYDTAMAMGQDRTLVFSRRRHDSVEAVPFKKVPLLGPPCHTIHLQGALFFSISEFEHDDVRIALYPRVVWFAGQRHGGVQVDRYDRRHRPGMSDTLYFWEAARFLAYLEEMGVELLAPRKRSIRENEIDQSNVEAFFSDGGTRQERDWLAGEGLSIAVSGTNKWRHDDVHGWKFDVDGLKLVQFQKLLPPYEAFQRLSQWVGGVLPRPSVPTVDIKDEKTMLAKHGMDSWSFRRPPTDA